MLKESTSSFNALDLLNQAAALAEGGATQVRPKPKPTTKFESVVNSLNSFLTTATDTIITVDGIINDQKSNVASYNTGSGQGRSNQQPIPGQHVASTSRTSLNFGQIALWGGVAVGASALAYKLLSGKKKSE